MNHGFARIAAVSLSVRWAMWRKTSPDSGGHEAPGGQGVQAAVFPELCLTAIPGGYAPHPLVQRRALEALERLATATGRHGRGGRAP